MKKEITKVEKTVAKKEVATPQDAVTGLISQAIAKGVDAESLEKFMALRTQLKAEWSKSQFDNAMANFQGDCPVIEKKTEAKNGDKKMYSYAELGYIVSQVKELLKDNGLSYSFRTENSDKKVKVTCIAKHRDGHSEESVMETDLATKTGIMSLPQQTASTVTFCKRYSFVNIFGIMTGDEDTDAKDEKAEMDAQNAIDVNRKALENCTTVEQLGGVWGLLDPRLQPSLESIKDEMKAKLTSTVTPDIDFESVDSAIEGEVIKADV